MPQSDTDVVSELHNDIAGNVPVYFTESQLRALTRLIQAYPAPYPAEVPEALDRMEKTLSIM